VSPRRGDAVNGRDPSLVLPLFFHKKRKQPCFSTRPADSQDRQQGPASDKEEERRYRSRPKPHPPPVGSRLPSPATAVERPATRKSC